jgi:hypothetical protein
LVGAAKIANGTYARILKANVSLVRGSSIVGTG